MPKAPIFLCFTKLVLALQITILAKMFIIVLCDMVQNVKEGQTIGFITGNIGKLQTSYTLASY